MNRPEAVALVAFVDEIEDALAVIVAAAAHVPCARLASAS